MSDRDLQDTVITALADGPFRSSEEWLGRRLADPARVEKFSRFLARHFYYERIVHFFKYSGALSNVTGRRPEAVLATQAFSALLPPMVLGSRASAEQVSALVVQHVSTGEACGQLPYLDDLLRYEQAMMVAESGPRVWRDDEAGPLPHDAAVFEPDRSTQLLDLGYDITVVLQSLLGEWTEAPQAPRESIRLLVARSPHGRVIVAHSTAATEALLQLADGRRNFTELVQTSGLDEAELKDALEGLTEWGALKVSLGS